MNPKQWTYKQRNLALLAVAALLLVMGYWAAFGKTWQLWQQNKQLQSQSGTAGNIDMQLAQLEKQMQYLEAIYATTDASVASHHEALLAQVSAFCQTHKLLVREFPPAVFHEETQYLIETNQVTVEGNFKDIVKLVYDLEQVNRIGRVASVTFEAGPDRKTRQYRLAAHIVIQNIKPKANEI